MKQVSVCYKLFSIFFYDESDQSFGLSHLSIAAIILFVTLLAAAEWVVFTPILRYVDKMHRTAWPTICRTTNDVSIGEIG